MALTMEGPSSSWPSAGSSSRSSASASSPASASGPIQAPRGRPARSRGPGCPARRSPAGRGAWAGPGLRPARIVVCPRLAGLMLRLLVRHPRPVRAAGRCVNAPRTARLVPVLSVRRPWYAKRQGADAPLLARPCAALATAPTMPRSHAHHGLRTEHLASLSDPACSQRLGCGWPWRHETSKPH